METLMTSVVLLFFPRVWVRDGFREHPSSSLAGIFHVLGTSLWLSSYWYAMLITQLQCIPSSVCDYYWK